MKTELDLMNPVFDKEINDSTQKDMNISCSACIFQTGKINTIEENGHAFDFWIEYGKDDQKTMMFEVDIDELEEFAYSILKKIEIFRRDNEEEIKERIKRGFTL